MTNPENYEDGVEYIDLFELISFDGFSFAEYFKGERELLNPRLEDLGYSNMVWGMGEYDSFGPLTRVVTMKNKDGEVVHGIYG